MDTPPLTLELQDAPGGVFHAAPGSLPLVKLDDAPDRECSGVGGVRNTLTHSLLIEQAAKWLQRKGCSIVITDMAHQGPETPDAIGWYGRAGSIVIECKASLSDFRADAQKCFRRDPARGMGCQRYFCAMRGMLPPDKLPPKWGLLEWDGKKMRETKKPEHHRENGAREEISLLMSAIRRIAHEAPKGISVKCYTMESKQRATLGVLPGGGGAEPKPSAAETEENDQDQ